MHWLASIITTTVLAIGGFLGIYSKPQTSAPASVSFGATNSKFAQLQPYALYGGGAVAGATSITLKSMKDIDGNTLTMSGVFGSKGYGTLEPGNGTQEEQISFTGLINNSNGSVTLTGVSNVGFVYPYTETSGLSKTHPGSAKFVISNTAGFYNQFVAKANDGTISETLTFTSTAQPVYDAAPTFSNPLAIIDKAYADSGFNQGAATSTETNGGIVELGTLAEQASSFDGGANKPTVLQTKNSTSTCQVVGSYNIVASTTTGKLDPNCIGGSGVNYTFQGNTTISSSTISTLQVRNSTTTGTQYYGNKLVPTPYFGGTGVDGALSISSGTTTLNTNGAAVLEKDYTSISITGTGSLNFTGTTTNSLRTGTRIILRSQGACTLTSSSMTMIDLRWLGGGPGNAHSGVFAGSASAAPGSSGGSTGGVGQDSITAAGSPNYIASVAIGGTALEPLSTSTLMAPPGGNGSADQSANAGGLGAGGLTIECAGALNFTTGGIKATGVAGTTNGGGGAGGNVLIRYISLTADSGTYATTGGGGGTTGADGTHLEAQNTYSY